MSDIGLCRRLLKKNYFIVGIIIFCIIKIVICVVINIYHIDASLQSMNEDIPGDMVVNFSIFDPILWMQTLLYLLAMFVIMFYFRYEKIIIIIISLSIIILSIVIFGSWILDYQVVLLYLFSLLVSNNEKHKKDIIFPVFFILSSTLLEIVQFIFQNSTFALKTGVIILYILLVGLLLGISKSWIMENLKMKWVISLLIYIAISIICFSSSLDFVLSDILLVMIIMPTIYIFSICFYLSKMEQ